MTDLPSLLKALCHNFSFSFQSIFSNVFHAVRSLVALALMVAVVVFKLNLDLYRIYAYVRLVIHLCSFILVVAKKHALAIMYFKSIFITS